ncbi:HSP20-like chaperone [Cladochytrium replicatum]|nr:HSP20-like chaperone [Cladochytrium replicatum]
MPSRVWNPFSLFDRDALFRDFDNYVRNHIDSVNKTEQQQHHCEQCMRAPRMDVGETESMYLIHVDLPGLKKEDVNIRFRDDILTIEGERKDERSWERGGKVHFYERSFGKFQAV